MPEVRYKLAAGTDTGLIRQNNEDNFIVSSDLAASEWTIPQVDDFVDLGAFGVLLVVADGMGGTNAGEVASGIAVQTVREMFTPEQVEAVVHEGDRAIQDFMREVVKVADLHILARSQEDSATRGMGTTVVMAWVVGRMAYVCWCGDSRCYVYGKRGGLTRLTKDHSYVQELIDKGELEAQYASSHPMSNVITRCLGDAEQRANPDTRMYRLRDGDILLLCSDGLSALCDDVEIMDVLADYQESPADCKNELIAAALAQGGYDNVTTVLCKVSVEGEESEEEEELEEDLSTTVRSAVIGHRVNSRLLSVLLLMLCCAVVYVLYASACAETRHEVAAALSPVWAKLKDLVP